MSSDESTLKLDPAIFIIFGITGDLSRRKVLPALYHLFKDNLMPEQVEIVGTSRRELSADDLLRDVELCVLENDNVCDPAVMKVFRDHLRMVKVDPDTAEDYQQLKQTLDQIENDHGVCMNRLFYLSIPPQVYGSVVRQLGENGLNESCQHGTATSRLLVEKPFGHDLKSAEELIAATDHYFPENQVFRIDHYLAKETAQNILAFRAHNPVFAAAWNNQQIERVEVIAAEQIDIEGRAGFYDAVGALRDLIQSHLMQLLALATMDVPADINDSSAIHAAKLALLASIAPIDMSRSDRPVRRAQYEGYRDEVNNPDSATETFAQIRLSSNADRWQGVPFMLTTGKALAQKLTHIVVTFKGNDETGNNKLTFRLQPNEGIDLELTVKKPGFATAYEPAAMDFSYQNHFDEHGHPDAYERVLTDAVRGDHSLFATSQEVLASWRILQPLLDTWSQDASDLTFYPKGSAIDDILKA